MKTKSLKSNEISKLMKESCNSIETLYELELIEDNHFLRLIEHGVKIRGVEVNDAKISVDTKDDLAEVRSLMQLDEVKNNYLNIINDEI